MDGFSGGVWGVQTPPGSGKHPPENVETPPKKLETPPEISLIFNILNYTLQFRLFHYDEIILTAKA